MNTMVKGELAQLKAELRAIEKGFVTSRPTSIARYDLVIDDGSKLWRTQVKYAGAPSNKTPNSVVVSLAYQARDKSEHAYTEKEVDSLVVYVPQVDKLLWFTAEQFCGKLKLQVKFRGEQRSNSIWYEDYIW